MSILDAWEAWDGVKRAELSAAAVIPWFEERIKAAEADRDRLARENERLTEALRKIGRGDYTKSDAEFYARKALDVEEPA